jgi:hypothetical protein
VRGNRADRHLDHSRSVTLARIIAELGIKRWTVTSILYRLLKRGSIEHAGRDTWQIRSAG